MPTIGYFLSAEEYAPDQLIEQARLAEEAGFDALWISDHYHPWTSEQGQSPFVWSMIGALAQVCDLPVTTAVTCPTLRIHPAVIAQAAATSAVLLGEGRFRLGVGSGEALNEHVLGDAWPEADVRLEMLEESVEVIRALWTGDVVSHRGRHYVVENARIWTRPETPPEILVSGFGPKAVDVAARIGDGYVTTSPDQDLLDRFRKQAREGATTQAGFKVALGGQQGPGHRLRPPDLAERRAARRAGPGPADRRALRAGLAAGHPGGDRRVGRGRTGPEGAPRRVPAVPRRRVRRDLRREHGAAVRRHDPRIRARGPARAPPPLRPS